ncbi:mucin-17-like [Notolabrus celidotus]|uniref:mucin-17-like n=1 Tax=Notolabrus celidotus TaxID=1203425 RepID=UPI00148FB75F|nr:mucin-17-like [Notolabrus celidotus]
MALSQIQCLDDNHVNPRTHESKPEFLYCEDQRLALEALLRDGREAFAKFLETRGLRDFLSDPELDALTGSVEPFDPDLDLYPEDAEDDEPPLSQQYWPDLSDTSTPMMDLGWPDTESYRGVTRTTVYAQPPLEGQTHIKERVRKMIAQAQKVIAVVMDVFTDVDIFRDMLDVSFKKKVAVYILLEHASLPHFLSMCRRANMHAGHLKHLRVRCGNGAEFHTRSSKRVRGQMGHRFMFIDGDKAVSGSYSFTWMSARLHKNLITVVTGQAVDAFDRLFRTLYSYSTSVDLRKVATEPEPEPEPIKKPVPVAPPSAAIARKLYNPKYSLVALGNPATSPSADKTPQETPEESLSPEDKRRRRKQSKEALQEGPPLHPGLVDLEKVCLFAYLPTWPEPDPSKDVIGFINIRDAKKPHQAHLQRSEMFETSQAIKFSSPFSMPKETLPDVAMPRQSPAKPGDIHKLHAAQHKTKAGESRTDGLSSNGGPEIKSKVGAASQNSPKCESNKDTAKTPLGSPTNQSSGHNNTHTDPQSSPKTSIPNPWMNRYKSQIVTKNSPTSDFFPGSNTQTETTLNTHGTQTSHTQKQTVAPHLDSHTQSQNSSKITPHIPTPTAKDHVSSSASPPSENNKASSSSPSSVPQLTSSSPPLPTSSEASSLPSSTPPIPKPRTIQLLLKDGITSDGKKLLETNTAEKSETNTRPPPVLQNQSAVVQTPPEKQAEMQKNSTSVSGIHSVNIQDSPQPKEDGTSQKMRNKEVEANVEALPKSVNHQGNTPNKTLTSTESKLTQQIDAKQELRAPGQNVPCSEVAKTPKSTTHRVTNSEKAPEIQNISDRESVQNNPQSTCTQNNTHSNSEELSPKSREGKHTPEKPLQLPLSDSHTADLRSPDKEPRLLTAQTRTPTPDRLPSPDLQTLTPDVSDGYTSGIEDSNLSTTSEEYYECCGSPCLLESALDAAANPNQGTAEDHVSFALTSSPNAVRSVKKITSSDASSSSSTPKKKAERKEGDSAGSGVKESKERVEKKKEALTQLPKKKKVPNQSAAADGGGTPGLSTGDPKAKTVSPGKEGADKEKGAGVVVRREKPNKEAEGQKFVQTPNPPAGPSRYSRPLSGQFSGPRPWGSIFLNKTDTTLHHGSLQVLDNSYARKPLTQPHHHAAGGGVRSAGARGHTNMSRSQQSLLSDGLKHRVSLLHSHSNSQPQLSPPPQDLSSNRKVEGRGPFSLTFSKLYSLKDLKDKMSKLPAPGRKSSTSSPLQERKSTS